MTFRVGDLVLWWGEVRQIAMIETRPLPSGENETVRIVARPWLPGLLPLDGDWVSPESLAAHQRPWRYDKALAGWVPDEGQERIAA